MALPPHQEEKQQMTARTVMYICLYIVVYDSSTYLRNFIYENPMTNHWFVFLYLHCTSDIFSPRHVYYTRLWGVFTNRCGTFCGFVWVVDVTTVFTFFSREHLILKTESNTIIFSGSPSKNKKRVISVFSDMFLWMGG